MGENLVRDLFGDVCELPSGRRGRPAHRWSKSAADRVMMGLAMGYKPREIAAGLGISEPTLRKHYFAELKRASMQRMRYELWEAEKLAEQANAGNVGAIKELRRRMDRRDALEAERRLRSEDVAPAPVGKKEAARLAAERAAAGENNSDWGGLLQPGYQH